jgi:alpha-beta hydrolase superfamily lysophospholipase
VAVLTVTLVVARNNAAEKPGIPQSSALAMVLTPAKSNGKLVVYFHGAGETARAPIQTPALKTITDPLLAAGYTIASSDAGGVAWGNPESVDDYLALIQSVKKDYSLHELYFIAGSMGGVPSLEVMNRTSDVKAWAGIFPVCDVSTLKTNVAIQQQLHLAYPKGVPLSRLSPIPIDGNVPMLFWASPGDRTVPAATNAAACAARVVKAGGDARVITTQGDHGDPSNYDPATLLAFFASH